MKRRILISGCSGAGKSTVIAELKARGHRVVEEPGRRIVAQEKAGPEKAGSGTALPWLDLAAFAHRAIALSRSDLQTSDLETADLQAAGDGAGPVFFDRGLIDAAVALEHAEGTPYRETLGDERPYDTPVFLAPPWPEIFASDEDRRHDFAAAAGEFERLEAAFRELHYDIRMLPKTDPSRRADFILGIVA